MLMSLILKMKFEISLKLETDFFQFKKENSKVFEQKGDLLNFKANIDPMTLLS